MAQEAKAQKAQEAQEAEKAVTQEKENVIEMKAKREIHPESPLNIPLVKMAVADPIVNFMFRRVDTGWANSKVILSNVTGFNPHSGNILLGAKSPAASWFQDMRRSARWLNANDTMIRSVLFIVHDYLHIWGYNVINSLKPELGFGTAPITQKNFNDFLFCHLLTEAVAVVGLDYWYLSTIHLNKVLNIGTEVKHITVSYHEDDREEYEMLNFKHEVQSPGFFWELVKFYCEGGPFMGIWQNALERSPTTQRWVNHEVDYAKQQRSYSRMWLSHLSDQRVKYKGGGDAVIPCSEKWQRELADNVAEMLWEKVKKNSFHNLKGSMDVSKCWKSKKKTEWDFRFKNVNKATEQDILSIPQRENVDVNFRNMFFQYVSTFDYDTFDKELIKLFGHLIERRDFKLIEHLFKGQKRLPENEQEPHDIFILN